MAHQNFLNFLLCVLVCSVGVVDGKAEALFFPKSRRKNLYGPSKIYGKAKTLVFDFGG